MFSLKDIDINKLTPMMKQYYSIKKDALDMILLYRLGDFYEMFFDDAIIASKILGIALTGRECGLDERAPMCGVPYHAATQYIKNLIDNGYKVAICEQLEDPVNSKGIVKRGITKIFTPGTILDDEYLNSSDNNFIASIYVDEYISIVFCDVSTGEIVLEEKFNRVDTNLVFSEIEKFNPSEIIINEENLLNTLKKAGWNTIYKEINRPKTELELLELTKNIVGINDFSSYSNYDINAMYTLFKYLIDNKNSKLNHINLVKKISRNEYMWLDDTAIRNLELTKTIFDGTKKGSLISILDKTVTSKGSRMLKNMIERPLMKIEDISTRHDIVELFFKDPIHSENIRNYLEFISDIERIISKIVTYIASPRDLINLKTTLEYVYKIKNDLSLFDSDSLKKIKIEPNDYVYNLIHCSISDEPSNSINDGNCIKDGYCDVLDQIKNRSRHSEDLLLNYETDLKKQTGIKNLRVKYNKVTGYFIEVSKGQIDNVPDLFRRIQTLKNVERYTTSHLAEIEYKILNSSKEALELEKEIYNDVLDKIIPHINELKFLAENIAKLDCLLSLAEVARLNRYVRPNFNNKNITEIKLCRHPVVEINTTLEDFIPNNVYFDNNCKYAIITGPNMSGKSTYMRTIALNQIMAQMGSFIPADSANICIIDKIFTRIGASDALNLGQSTFMVEMKEVANILQNATSNSLLILDEVGRGTGTYDGMSIAFSLLEYIAKNIGAKTMFSTHYQELSELENKIDSVFNLTLEVSESNNEILFLRKVKHGITSKSYGIHVAKLAGLPESLTKVAEKYQEYFTKNSSQCSYNIPQYNFLEKEDLEEKKINSKNNEIVNQLKNLNLDNMSPIDALKFLYDIRNKLNE